MWEGLDSPGVVEMVRASCHAEHATVLARIIAEASARPWASDVSVVTSLGELRLTTSRATKGDAYASCVWITVNGDGTLTASYVPRGSSSSAATFRRPIEDGMEAVELARILVTSEADEPEVPRPSDDGDTERPRLAIGDRVRVIVSERNRTPRSGTVARSVWHHNLGCWMYYLVGNGRHIKKRYTFHDLELAP